MTQPDNITILSLITLDNCYVRVFRFVLHFVFFSFYCVVVNFYLRVDVLRMVCLSR